MQACGLSLLEGVSQMDSILPERLLALVRPGNDLVLRRIRSLKRCVEACGCNITMLAKCPAAAFLQGELQKTVKKRKPARSQPEARSQPNQPEANQKASQTSQKPTRKPAESQPNPARSQLGANQTQPKPSQKPAKSQPEASQKPARKPARVSFEGARLAETKAAAGHFAKPHI